MHLPNSTDYFAKKYEDALDLSKAGIKKGFTIGRGTGLMLGAGKRQTSNMSSKSEAADGEQQRVDIWRDSLVRYLGYSNELGESFRPISPRLVVPSYALAFAYVLGDTADKASRANERARIHQFSPEKRNAVITDAAIDTLLWQTMVALSSAIVQQTVKNSPVARRWAPTAIGLGMIPFIIHPIDHFVDQIMDQTTRKWSASFLEKYDK